VIAGTPQYMSPEQAGGDAVDHRSDLFSLGSVLYAMTIGRPPFRAETLFGVLRRIRETPPRSIREINPDTPVWLERLVLKLLSKDAADRIATATEVAAILEQCLAHVQQPTTVELPDAIGRWALLPVHSESNQAVSDRRVQPPTRWIALATVALIAIGLAVWWRPLQPVVTKQFLPLPTAEPTLEPTAEPSTLDPLLQWDATQTQLDVTASVIDELEATTQRDFELLESAPAESPDSRRKEAP